MNTISLDMKFDKWVSIDSVFFAVDQIGDDTFFPVLLRELLKFLEYLPHAHSATFKRADLALVFTYRRQIKMVAAAVNLKIAPVIHQ